MTGVSIGIMRPDPRPVLYEVRCPRCDELIRDVKAGVVGEEQLMTAMCNCGTKFDAALKAKELDS